VKPTDLGSIWFGSDRGGGLGDEAPGLDPPDGFACPGSGRTKEPPWHARIRPRSDRVRPRRAAGSKSENHNSGKQTSVSNLYPQASHSHRCRTRRASRYSDHSGRKIVSRHWAHSLTGREPTGRDVTACDGRSSRELVFSSMSWPPANVVVWCCFAFFECRFSRPLGADRSRFRR
jgi:hypothetical protein